MRHQIVLLSLILVMGDLQAQSLSKKEFDDLRGSTISSCFRIQRAGEVNRGIGDKEIKEYCACYANAIFPAHTTVEEVRNGIAIQRRHGDKAMLDFFLKGRDLYEIGENCIARAFRSK